MHKVKQKGYTSALRRVRRDADFLFASDFAACRLTLSTIAGARLFGQLNVVGLDDGRDQPGKALIDFGAAGDVAHLHALAFAAIKR